MDHFDFPELADNLPESGREDELQQISFVTFQSLLPDDKFLFRDERASDKGVDATIEVKFQKRVFNFRACLQFKGTDSEQLNEDGSFSKQVDVSNLNYLLNGHCPMYVLYIEPRSELRFLWASDIRDELNRQNPTWKKQKTVTLRFSKILDSSSFDEIHRRILKESVSLNRLRDHLKANPHLSAFVQVADGSSPHVKQRLSLDQLWAIAEAHPESGMAWTELASALYESEDFKNALWAINRAWEVGPRELEMKSTRACILAEYAGLYGGPRNLIIQAIELFEELRSYGDNAGMTDYNIGNCYTSLGATEEAVQHFEKALTLQTTPEVRAQIYTNLGNLYDDLGKTEEAARAHQKALEFCPNHWQSLAGWASIESNRGNYKIAAGLLEKCLEVNPDLERSGYKQISVLARCYFELGQYERSLIKINQALSVEPNDDYSRNVKINILKSLLVKNKSYASEAIAFFKDEIANGNHVSDLRSDLFVIYLELNERNKARQVLEDEIKDGQPPARALFLYAGFLKEDGNLKGAITHLKEALSQEDEHYICHRLGDYLLEAEEYGEAAIHLKNSAKGKCHSFTIMSNIAWCYKKQGDYLQFLLYTAKSILIDPRHADAWHNFKIGYRKLGKSKFAYDLMSINLDLVESDEEIFPSLEQLLFVLEKEFGSSFVQSVSSCDIT